MARRRMSKAAKTKAAKKAWRTRRRKFGKDGHRGPSKKKR